MGLFGKKKKVKDTVIRNTIGDEVHVRETPSGTMFVKKLNMSDYLYSGEEYCPDCHILMDHRDGYWECPTCCYSITDEESEAGEGHPTMESTYEDDYGEYYGGIEPSNDDDEF